MICDFVLLFNTCSQFIQAEDHKRSNEAITSLADFFSQIHNTALLHPTEASMRTRVDALNEILVYISKIISQSEKSEGDHEDCSEEEISSWVIEACAKGVILLDALHKCGGPDIHKGVLASLRNWLIAAYLFASLSGPMPLVRNGLRSCVKITRMLMHWMKFPFYILSCPNLIQQ